MRTHDGAPPLGPVVPLHQARAVDDGVPGEDCLWCGAATYPFEPMDPCPAQDHPLVRASVEELREALERQFDDVVSGPVAGPTLVYELRVRPPLREDLLSPLLDDGGDQ